jgi:hypothetical protein
MKVFSNRLLMALYTMNVEVTFRVQSVISEFPCRVSIGCGSAACRIRISALGFGLNFWWYKPTREQI